MRKPYVTFLSIVLASSAAFGAGEPMKLKITGVENGKFIPERFAYCIPDDKGQTRDGGNISPEIQWTNAPDGTKSFALIVVDKDVPASFDDANKKGKTIAEDAPRQNFYHWVLTDIPANMFGFPEGKSSNGMMPGGKYTGKTDYGMSGQNDYAKAFGGAEENRWGGYDGPCPPWNDARLHRYHFVIYALDVETLGLHGSFTGPQAEEAMKGHVLATAEVVGNFSNNAGVNKYFGK